MMMRERVRWMRVRVTRMSVMREMVMVMIVPLYSSDHHYQSC